MRFLVVIASSATAQQRTPTPHAAYVYPAGGRQGEMVEVTVGGQYLVGPVAAFMSGPGVHATAGAYNRPLNNREAQLLVQKLQEAQKKIDPLGPARPGLNNPFMLRRIAREAGVTDAELKQLDEFRKLRQDPKRQLNPQLEEKVTVTIRIDADAAPGKRELRLQTAMGLTNPVWFEVGQLRECRESEPNDVAGDACVGDTLPVTINGQITPGDIDRFTIPAKKGMNLVIAAAAREIMPYLADAVPGWFQPVLRLTDSRGKEVGYSGGYRFSQDPVLLCRIPEDGDYTLEVRDALYRGREDFVYRITVGELPFVAGVYPLGGRDTGSASLVLAGWNLPESRVTVECGGKLPGNVPVTVTRGGLVSNSVPFQIDTIPSIAEEEPNDTAAKAQRISPPVIVNGRIDRPGDEDVYCFQGHAGQKIVLETYSRRLGSPVDTTLTLTDSTGKLLALNDDYDDKSAALITHQADSNLLATLPHSGAYYVRVRDAQRNGGPEYAYRLRISPPRPDFELRVTPSSVTARAGTVVPITVWAIRRDGFSGEIALSLKNAPIGFTLAGAMIPTGQDSVQLTLSIPPAPRMVPATLKMVGRATIGDQDIVREAQPAEDMEQAFAYHHLVPVSDWTVAVLGRGFGAPIIRVADGQPLRITAGASAQLKVTAPKWLLTDELHFSLRDAPEGITIQKVAVGPDGAAVTVSADRAKVKSGFRGNLILDAFRTVTVTRPNGSKAPTTRQAPVGTLPAIPFEISGP